MKADTADIEIRSPVHRTGERRAQVQIFYAQLPCHHCRKGFMEFTGEAHEKGTVHTCTHENCKRSCVVPGESYPHLVYEIPENRPGLDGMRRIK